jgi:hypothetical protein
LLSVSLRFVSLVDNVAARRCLFDGGVLRTSGLSVPVRASSTVLVSHLLFSREVRLVGERLHLLKKLRHSPYTDAALAPISALKGIVLKMFIFQVFVV